MDYQTRQMNPCSNIEPRPVVSLLQLGQSDLELAGGKGANLGELVQAGFPVPPGFVVSTLAYDCFVTRNRLDAVIEQNLHAGTDGCATIRSAFESAPIPNEIEQLILEAYQKLGQVALAVRSSATAEDLPEAAFAGQQDTFLNVIGTHALLDAVRRCWASLWTERAVAYRQRLEIDQSQVKLAVVLQQMVPATAAGVMFTGNPVTGKLDETVIDASQGLGEAVVSGLVTPDHYILRQTRFGWRIAEKRLGQREVVIRYRAGGGVEHINTPPGTIDPALPEQAIRRLAGLGMDIQRHFGAPQDIEWAWTGGQIFILQARPITAMAKPAPRTNKLQRWVAQNFVEMLPMRPYPLDLDTWMKALTGAIEPLFALMGMKWSLAQLFDSRDGVVVRYLPDLPRPTWRTLLAPVRFIRRALGYDPTQWQDDPLLNQMVLRAKELERVDLQALSWESLLGIVHSAIEIPYLAAGQLRLRYFPPAAFAVIRLRILLALLGKGAKLGTLLSGVTTKTTEMNQALEELAEKVRTEEPLAALFAHQNAQTLLPALEALPEGRAFIQQLNEFLDHFGHRETMISSSLQPTWKDAPEMVLGIVRSFAAHPPKRQNTTLSHQQALDQVLSHPLLNFKPLRVLFLDTLQKARMLLPIREDTHFYATLAMPIFRHTLLEMGNRLVELNILETAEDVYSLRLVELEQFGKQSQPPAAFMMELGATARRRKRERALVETKPVFDPRVLTPDDFRAGEALLHGTAGSPGVAEGKVRVVCSIAEFDTLTTGDVLVAPYTNPSWTPLFQRAAAVVVDSGSPASHAAIIAREYGIPAVMGTLTATQTLQDGDLIRVDGSRGLVYRISSGTKD